MCKHEVIKFGKMRICKKCGLTVSENGKFICFEKGIEDYYQNRNKHRKRKRKGAKK